jgi:Heterokaryon incompatibility protein (HET)
MHYASMINQADTSEPSQQVSIMGPIYSQCKNAALWLGREFEEADAVAEAAFLRDPLDPNLAFSGSKDSVSPILHRIRIDPRMGKKLQYFRRTESVEDELNERKLFNLDA